MTCKKKSIYLINNKTKQTFANLPLDGCIYDGFFAYIRVGSNVKKTNRIWEWD